MSLDKFQIPIALLPELYKDSLVVLDKQQVITDSLKEQKFISLGSNTKNILLLVNDENALHSTDKSIEFLTGILSACKLSFADIALLNISGNKNAKYASLIESFKPKVVICFGIDPKKINLPFEVSPYQINTNQQITFLLASSLEVLAKNIEEKKVLWGCLKNIFSI